MVLLGSVIFNLANIMLVTAIAIAGMVVAYSVGIGLALVLGVLTNHFATPQGNQLILFIGIALIVAAILLNIKAYQKLTFQDSVKKAKGIMVSLIAGFLMGLFYRFVTESIAADYTDPMQGKITPYTALVIFALGLFVSSFVWNSVFMYRPLMGKKVTYKDYFVKGQFSVHLAGMLGGGIWSLGFILNLLAVEHAGSAFTYGLGQGAVLIAALWGVFYWNEFKEARGVTGLLTAMFLLFIAGLGLIIGSWFY